MTLSKRKCQFLYKKSGALHYKVSPDNFSVLSNPTHMRVVFLLLYCTLPKRTDYAFVYSGGVIPTSDAKSTKKEAVHLNCFRFLT